MCLRHYKWILPEIVISRFSNLPYIDDKIPNHNNIFSKICLSLIDNKYDLDKTNMEHIGIMQNEAIKLIENSQYTQPFMYKLIQILSRNDYLDRDEEIIDIIHSIQHDKIHYYSDFVMIQSCYYPLILMWYKKYQMYYQQLNRNNNNNQNTHDSRTMQQLLCWLLSMDYNIDIDQCANQYDIYWNSEDKKEIDMRMEYVFKQEQAPDNFDIMNTNISNMSVILKQFYDPCNHNLYKFINQHPQIMFHNTTLQHWW